MPRREKWQDRDPWERLTIHLDLQAAHALQAMQRGEASDVQQQNVLNWLLRVPGMAYEETFDPVNERISSYLAGRRSVGLAIVKHLHVIPSKIERKPDE